MLIFVLLIFFLRKGESAYFVLKSLLLNRHIFELEKIEVLQYGDFVFIVKNIWPTSRIKIINPFITKLSITQLDSM